MHARARVYVPSSSGHHVMTYLLIGENQDPVWPLAALQIDGTGASSVYLGVRHDRQASGGSPEAFPLDRWVCTTLSVDTNSMSTGSELWIDEVEIDDEPLPCP